MADMNFAEEAAAVTIVDGGMPKQTRKRTATPMEFLKPFEQLLELNDKDKSAKSADKSLISVNEGEPSELDVLQKQISREIGTFKRNLENSGQGKIKTSVIKVPNADNKTGHVRFNIVWISKDADTEAKPADTSNAASPATTDSEAKPASAPASTDSAAKPTATSKPTRLRDK